MDEVFIAHFRYGYGMYTSNIYVYGGLWWHQVREKISSYIFTFHWDLSDHFIYIHNVSYRNIRKIEWGSVTWYKQEKIYISVNMYKHFK